MGMETRERKIREGFHRVFGHEAPGSIRVVSAPGRVNLIGEHLDYNGGSVMPIGIERFTGVLAVPTTSNIVRVFSELQKESASWEITNAERLLVPSWANYVKGVFAKLREKKLVEDGMDIFIASDVPMGAGLSSSAALEVACAYAMLISSADGLPFLQNPHRHFDVARLCMEVEYEFAGVKCGLMDQIASVFSRQGQAIVFDTHYNSREYVQFFDGATIAVVDSGIRRNLSDSRYNDRRRECGEALNAIKTFVGQEKLRSWRDLSPELLIEIGNSLDPIVFKRACHVLSEMERVEEAARAIRVGAKEYFGRLMKESHESLRYNFEVSTPELDALCFIAENVEGVYGARLTGAGFGGCVIALLEKGAESEFVKYVSREYEKDTGITPTIFFTEPAPGAVELLKL